MPAPRQTVPSNETPLPLTLLVHRADGRLHCMLSDQRAVGLVGSLPWPEGLAAQWRGALQALSRSRPDTEREAALQAWGAQLLERLVPARLRDVLRGSLPRVLSLQTDAECAAFPWEFGFDGDSFLGQKFVLARHGLDGGGVAAGTADKVPRSRLTVLLAGSPAQVESVAAELAAIEGLAVVRRAVPGQPHEAGDVDVLHLLGTRSGFGGTAQWPAAAWCVVLETAGGPAGAALMAAACRSGRSGLWVDRQRRAPRRDDFMAALYRRLAAGFALGEATRLARAAALSTDFAGRVVALSALLHGDERRGIELLAQRKAQPDNLRQITVLSYDLVESTRLLASLGAERYSELLAEYHRSCAAIVARHDGASDDPQGDDGLMAYFGFPLAHEASAVHALRAALEIQTRMAELALQVRIGIATGQVVVKDGQPVGVVVHLAARLQAIAAPGSVVVGETTRQIVRERFAFRALTGLPALKGIDKPGAAFHLLGEMAGDAPEALSGQPGITPFVGRQAEMRALQSHWMAACRDGCRAVRVAGEAGIGKSRLLREFRQTLAARQQRSLELRCTPEHANSAFFPVIELLRRLLGQQDDDDKRRFARIEAALQGKSDQAEAPALVAALLGVVPGGQAARLRHSPERQRQLTLEVLAGWIAREAAVAPICLVVEDSHWIDPSSRDFLARLLIDARTWPLLVVSTLRWDPGMRAPAEPAPHEILLGRLSTDASRSLVMGTCGDVALPAEIVGQLAARADGVPLFIEESARMALDLHAQAPLRLRLEVPASIHDLLMARLDRVGPAKRMAQLGATIGREFSLALVLAVAEQSRALLPLANPQALLSALVASGLLLVRGDASGPVYQFKHALVRDVAYFSLLERERRQLHRTVALVLGEHFSALADADPESLARHYTEAGLVGEAVEQWARAARVAVARSAHPEAINHLTTALELLSALPAGRERDRSELRLQVVLAGQLIATLGYGADQVGRVYARAQALCEQVGDDAALKKIHLGLEGYHFMRADFGKAHETALQAARLAAHGADPMPRLQAAWATANILFHQGDLVAAVARMDACLADYDALPQRPGAMQDPGVMCLCYSAWGRWELGFPDDALRRAQRVVALSESLQHKFSLGEAYGFAAAVHLFRGESALARAAAARAIEICRDGGFAVWLAHAKMIHGRAAVALGDIEAGVEEMRLAYGMWAATGAVVTRPFYLALRAEGLARAGRPEEGLDLLEAGLGLVQRHGERYYEAELWRLSGELVWQLGQRTGGDRSADAERWLAGALEIAHRQQLHSLALRSALGLARLRVAQGRNDEAAALLQPALQAVVEGADTHDVQQATMLFAALQTSEAAPRAH